MRRRRGGSSRGRGSGRKGTQRQATPQSHQDQSGGERHPRGVSAAVTRPTCDHRHGWTHECQTRGCHGQRRNGGQNGAVCCSDGAPQARLTGPGPALVAHELAALRAEMDALDKLPIGVVVGPNQQSWAGRAHQADLLAQSRGHISTFAAFTVEPDEGRRILVGGHLPTSTEHGIHRANLPPPSQGGRQTGAPKPRPDTDGYPLIEGVGSE